MRRTTVTGTGLERAQGVVLVVALLAALAGQLAHAPRAHAAGVSWVWSGALTSTSVVVKARTAAESGAVRLLVSRRLDLSDPVATPPQASTAATDRVVTVPVTGLAPATRYHYAVEVDGVADLTRRGTFRTAPEGASSFTIAFGACASTGSNHPVFDAIRQADPLFFLHTGDIHYEDIATGDPAAFRAAYDRVLASPRQSRLYRDVPISYMWDDHDYGPNDADGGSPTKYAARQAYRERVPHHPLAAGPGDVAPYQAFTVGRVRFLVTDGRSERSPSGARDDASKTMLGAAQKAWLKAELLAARDRQALTVWVNTIPWVTPATPGGDHWGGYATERREIADFIRDHQVDRTLVMLSGDAHMLSAEDGTNSGYATGGGGGFPVLHAAALDRGGSVKGGPYSHGAYPGGGQFGLLSVTDTGGSEVTVSYSGRRTDGTELVRLAATVGDHLDRAPTVAAVTPAEAGVRTSTDVTARFSEPVDPASVSGASFTLTPAPSPAQPAPAPVPAVVTLDPTGGTARLDPVADLAPGRAYDVRLAGVRDALGNAALERRWSFRTAAAVADLAPTADAYTSGAAPATSTGASSGLLVDATPAQVSYLKFDLAAYAGRRLASASLDLRVTTNPSLAKPTLRAVADDTWTEAGLTHANRPAVGATVLGALGSTTTNTTYTVPVAVGAVAAELGGTLSLALQPGGSDGLLLASRETTTPPVLRLAFDDATAATDAQPPVVAEVGPAAGATAVDRAAVVTARFTEPVDPASVTASTFTLAPATGTGAPVAAVVTLAASADTATLDPVVDLPAGTTWTARLAGVRDRAGDVVAQHSWSFTTAAPPAPVTLAPTADTFVLSTAPATAFGGSTTLAVDASSTRTSYLRYDLTPYAGRRLTRAALTVRVATNPSLDTSSVRHVAHDGWSEAALTWAERPPFGAQVLGTLPPSTAHTTYTVPLDAPALAGELGGPLSLAVVAGGGDGLALSSRETGTPPVLTLQFG